MRSRLVRCALGCAWLLGASIQAVLLVGCSTEVEKPRVKPVDGGGGAGGTGALGGGPGGFGGGGAGAGGRDAGQGDAPGGPRPEAGTGDGRTCQPGRGKSLGASCGCAEECGSGFCVDGVCCNLACSGACASCNQPDSMGECSPVPMGQPDPRRLCKSEAASSCGQDGKCNGLGACTKHPPGTQCAPAACSGGALMPASSCDGNGTCLTGSAINCAPSMCIGDACKVVCGSTADCAAPNVCTNGSCGPRGLGQPCTDAKQCRSGFCADGVCCDGACGGRCMNCALPPTLGRCTAVAENAPDPRLAAGVTDATRICPDQGAASCGTNGHCDGAGGCQRYPAGTVCRQQSCDAAMGRWTPRAVCRDGACEMPAAQSCAPYKCDGARCGTGCDGTEDCAGTNLCLAGSCGKKALGALCARAEECSSNFCAQGVCCNARCNGTCQACNLAGSVGTCANVPAGRPDPQGGCADQGPASCGNDGACNGSGACRRYAANTECAPARCTGGMRTAASTCNGTGTCRPGSTVACAPYVCNPANANCFNSCTGTGDAPQCAPPNRCAGGKCGRAGRGQQCDETVDCVVGLTCVEGVCCDRPCPAPCNSCKQPTSVGTCTRVGCMPNTTQACGMNGSQTCTAMCRWGACTGQTCNGAAMEACGACGTRTRTCNNGTWSAWSACMNEGACSPDSQQSCGTGGTRTCNAMCQWGACGGQTCTGSATQRCGMCGTQTRTCNNGVWSDWGACAGQGVCAPNATQGCGAGGIQTCNDRCMWGGCMACTGPDSESCGNCGTGTRTRTCTAGQWGPWSACMGVTGCTPQSTQACGMHGQQTCNEMCQWGTCACQGNTSQTCGNCNRGTQTRTCNGGTWSDWGTCGGQPCAPGATRMCMNGGTETCSASCEWGSCLGQMCTGPAPTRSCGRCGTQARVCDNGTWGEFGPCTGEGVCAPSDPAQMCGMDGRQSCTEQCQWGACACVGDSMQACGNCMGGTRTRTCSNGTWSAWSACMGEPPCAAGATRMCGVNDSGMQMCSQACQWGTCTGQSCAGPAPTEACGRCGTRSRVCENGSWGDWGPCMGQGVCDPNDTGMCGANGSRTCTAQCTWGACNCVGPSMESCGNCGTRTRTCSDGTWSNWSACSGEGECAPSATQACDAGGMPGSQTCSAMCSWGTCNPTM
jgi:hypothetical protein